MDEELVPEMCFIGSHLTRLRDSWLWEEQEVAPSTLGTCRVILDVQLLDDSFHSSQGEPELCF